MHLKTALWRSFLSNRQIRKADFRWREKENLTDLNEGISLSTKVQHETLSINCGEDCTQHFRGAYFRSAAGVRAGVVEPGSSDGIEKNRK